MAADKPNLIYSKFLNDGSGMKYNEWAGASRHEKPKPENQASGSKFHEVDTAKIYAYDAGQKEWEPQIELGGGS